MGDEDEAWEWAAEVVYDLYTSHEAEHNIMHNLHCDHKASVFEFDLAGTTLSIKQNRGNFQRCLREPAQELKTTILQIFKVGWE